MLHRRRSTLLAGVCSLIAIVWFLLPVRPKFHASQPDEPILKVVTLNTLGSNPRLTEAAQWLASTNADVIILQEIAAEGYEPRLDTLYKKYPYQALIEGSVRIFTRYPIVEESPLWIEDGLPGRLMLRVLLDVDGERVAVYGVHLSLPYGEKSHLPIGTDYFPYSMLFGYDEIRRDAQIERLLARLEQEPYPYLVAGDFNMSATSTMYQHMRGFLLDSYAEAGAGFQHTWPVSRATALPNFVPPLLRIDYIWHSDALQAVHYETGPALGSDHLPVMAKLSLKPTR